MMAPGPTTNYDNSSRRQSVVVVEEVEVVVGLSGGVRW